MMTDFLLASLHHLLVYALVAMLVTESVLLRGAIDRTVLRRLAGVDFGYGLCAVALIVVGICRIAFGIKAYDFYLHNPWFHAKIGTFLLVGLLSILPTVRFLRWRKALAANPAYLPDPAEVGKMQRLLRFELILVAAIFVFAAAMARYGGL
jgi:putative membrane protein